MCEAEEREAERQKAEHDRYKKLMNGIPTHYRGADIDQFGDDDFDPRLDMLRPDSRKLHLYSDLLRWMDKPEGFVYVHGDCGTGKTHLACTAKKDFNRRGVPSQLVFANDLFHDVRVGFGKTTKDFDAVAHIVPSPDKRHVVIIDDIGALKVSDFVVEMWLTIIDRLYRFDYPTMITSNLPPKELSGQLSDRIASRVTSGLWLKMGGDDRRIVKHRASDL
jgi:DNA replication protein DnaC